MSHPPLLLTMGDACGIGPELIVRAYQAGQARGAVVVGDAAIMRRAAQALGGPPVVQVTQPENQPTPDVIPVWQVPDLPADLMQAPLGQVSASAGRAAYACIVQAVRLIQAGAGRALVTAPIHKQALHAAGVTYPGHTELLQALSTPVDQALRPVRMMLASPALRTVLVTIHLSLRQAIEAITFEAVLETLQITHQAATELLGLPAPKIAVAGLNPHAGEGGLFGDEEQRIIAPAIQAARQQGIHAQGPYAPDTIFMRARHSEGHPGEFDIVVAMVHDHGLIPIKYLGLEQGVNITLGLPFLRTSPDHGTAFDLAGKNCANPASLIAALRYAAP